MTGVQTCALPILLVYLDAIIESDKYKKSTLKPAAILYNRIDNPIVKSNEDQKDSIINEEILKKLRMNGLVLKGACYRNGHPG